MATTDPLTGATVYQQTDNALGGQQLGDVVGDLSSFTVPRFSTTAARDSAYSSWTSAGHSMTDGLACYAAGVYYRYISGAWRTTWLDYASARVPIGITGLVNPDAALTGVITVPAVLGVACRVVFIATGKSGNAASSRDVAWGWDSSPAGASNVTKDDESVRVTVAGSAYTGISSTLVMEVPAGTSATARLVYRGNGNAFNNGAVVWHRSPIV